LGFEFSKEGEGKVFEREKREGVRGIDAQIHALLLTLSACQEKRKKGGEGGVVWGGGGKEGCGPIPIFLLASPYIFHVNKPFFGGGENEEEEMRMRWPASWR